MLTIHWAGGLVDVPIEGRDSDLLVPVRPEPRLDLEAEVNALASAVSARGAARILVVVPDRTRWFPLARVLPDLVARLCAHGASPERITVAIASGTHLASERDLSPAHLGELPRGVSVMRHDAGASAAHCGVTPAGTVVEVAPVLLEADFVLALGGTAFHYFAGFGGGGKMLFPGLGARASVAANHRRALGPWPPGGLAPGVEPGRLAGNPVAEDLAAAHALLPRAHHLTLWPTGGGWAGARWRDAPAFATLAERYAGVRRMGEAGGYDVVVASCGGAARELDVVQAHKALFHASLYARNGGHVVFLAACDEGYGSHAIERWLALDGRTRLEEQARAAYDLNAQTAISLAAIAARVRVTWVSRRPLELLPAWGFEPAADATAACASALASASANARIGIVPGAPDVLPVEREHA